MSLAESAIIIASEFPTHPLAQGILSLVTSPLNPTTSSLRITPLFLLGTALTVGGALFRIASFRAMGKHFTYELAIRKDHRLITQFPYSVVRHPGYAGSMVAAAGANLVLFGAEGGFIRDVVLARLGWDSFTNHSRPGLVTAIMLGVGISQAFIVAAVLSRVPKEDMMMRNEFGKEWDDWAARVPYKLIPGIW